MIQSGSIAVAWRIKTALPLILERGLVRGYCPCCKPVYAGDHPLHKAACFRRPLEDWT